MWLTLIILLIVLAGVAFWLNAKRTHDLAVIAAKEMCQKAGWQLLDDTVSLRKLTLARNEVGRVCFYREYQFDYDLGDCHRSMKRIVMLGKQPLHKTSSEDNVIQFPKTKR